MTNILLSVDSSHVTQFQNLVPKVVEVIKNLIPIDQSLASTSLNLFEDLIECEIPIIAPHIKFCLQFFLEIGSNKLLEDQLRVKSLALLCDVISKKKKVILKMNAIPTLVNGVFSILCEDNPDTSDDDEDEEKSTASSFASQVIDIMALHLPPEKFIPHLLKLTEPAMNSENVRVRSAAFLAVAVSTEGCSENIRIRHMKKLLRSIYKGMLDEASEVRNSAMFALGEFSEYLQPDISKFSQELLPLLFDCLNKFSFSSSVKKKDIVRTYHAMEKFCENLGKEILPYLPQLMEFLLNSIANSQSFEIKEYSISAIAATASSAKEHLLPFLPRLLELLKTFLSPTEEEGPLKVQVQTIDTLGVLVRTLGESFDSLAPECLVLGLSLINDATDPDLRRSIYGLFAACSLILRTSMEPHVGRIFRLLVDCLKSTEGITAHYDDEDAEHVLDIFEDDSINLSGSQCDTEYEHDNDHDNVESIDLQNSYMDEKVEAMAALGELALNTEVAFASYLEESFKESSDLLTYPDSDIKRTAALCVGQLCSATYKLIKLNAEMEKSLSGLLEAMLSTCMRSLVEMVREEEEREVAISVFESLNEVIKTVGKPALQVMGSVSVIFNLVKDVVRKKLKCQDGDIDEEEDEEEAEYDTLLIESAGDLIPLLAKVVPSNEFITFFSAMLPELMKKLKKSSSVADRSFAIGTLAETMLELGDNACMFVSKLYPVMMSSMKDDDDEVRNNAVFGLGVLAANGGQNITSHYHEILKGLSDAMVKETDRRVVDNICGALARMITSNCSLVPLDQVLPTIINHLPLQEDLEEHITVFQSFASLYAQRNVAILPHLPQVLVIIGNLLVTKPKPELEKILKDFVNEIYANSPDVFQAVPSSDADLINRLKSCIKLP
ncbi:hypothetical protein HELRODRAFT_104231 [Helobdella robusta]|uniref:TOG domain-containing protein n=1 Tax=Helobdella robusta TaxID=6412 RepID=T1EDK5_HELRO|nr:hypothetical protein HELRODRAFT_104231 [Helobdella robusta]ESN91050.1 hypothetical protein HELRODRAFT_104231 [Helobdella robusta]